VPSPLYHNGLVYFVKNGGVLTCLELKTGKSIYRMRTSGSGTHYSSPIIADGKLFTISGAGRITVLSLGPAAKILATNEMGEPTYATPAVVDGTIYVRTHTRLFAFANQKWTDLATQRGSFVSVRFSYTLQNIIEFIE
ncbi:MAG: PQQ-binding-like beta-propeller repeat protein, partial [Pirellulaceae bacterium]